MTRTARRNLKKSPLSATPWSSLKANKYTYLKDEGSPSKSSSNHGSKASTVKSDLKKVKGGQLKETRRKKLNEKLPTKVVKKVKQIGEAKKLRAKLVKEDSETVSLLPQVHTKSKTKKEFPHTGKVTAKQVVGKKKPKLSSSDENFLIRNPALDSLLEDGEADSDKTPLLRGSRAMEKKRRQAEARRLRRQRKKVCFNCRKPGHKVEDCPEPQSEQAAGMCYKCGSAEHTSRKCTTKTSSDQEYPYAKCFICGEVGHLSKACPDNPKGLYPNGGCCKLCGSVEHLRANCPEKLKQAKEEDQGSANVFGGLVANPYASADAEDLGMGGDSSALDMDRSGCGTSSSIHGGAKNGSGTSRGTRSGRDRTKAGQTSLAIGGSGKLKNAKKTGHKVVTF